jgi:hypothetical protein
MAARFVLQVLGESGATGGCGAPSQGTPCCRTPVPNTSLPSSPRAPIGTSGPIRASRAVDGTRVITLDTSCVSALAKPQCSNDPDELEALESLVDLARHEHIVLQLTTAYERDFERWSDDDGRSDRLRWLVAAPPIRRVSGVFRLDVSRLDGADILAESVPGAGARPGNPVGIIGHSADIAYMVLYFCSPATRFVSGQVIAVDGAGTVDLLKLDLGKI